MLLLLRFIIPVEITDRYLSNDDELNLNFSQGLKYTYRVLKSFLKEYISSIKCNDFRVLIVKMEL